MSRLCYILLFLSATILAGQGHSYQEEVDAIMYGQSFLVQAMIEVCDDAFPEDAQKLNKAWTAWEKANRKSVKRGKQAMAKIEKTNDPEADARKMAAEIRDQVRKETDEEKRKACTNVLELLRRESKSKG